MNESKQIIEKIEDLLTKLKSSLQMEPKFKVKTKQGSSDIKTGFSGLTQDIFTLIQEGFFDKPKTISEIQKKLRSEGNIKPVTSLMRPILFLLRKKILGRNKPDKGTYQYYQRTKL